MEMINSELKMSPEIESVSRIGKQQEDRPRLLKVELKALSDKKMILSRAKQLRNSTHTTYSNVYIRPDLTKAQLTEAKNLRATLKEMRQEHPDKKWTIRYNKIIETQD